MSEAAIKAALKKYLKAKGAFYVMPVQMGYGAASVDFLVCYRGFFIGIETKREDVHTATRRQVETMEEIIRARGWAWLENSPDLKFTRLQFDKIERWSDALFPA